MPTEAEWEYAARGGNKSKGFIYAGSNDAYEVAWFKDNSSLSTHPVGLKLHNELGLFDMSGNVWEWCKDWYATYSSDDMGINPSGPSNGTAKVLRGGTWYYSAKAQRVCNRDQDQPNSRGANTGFRFAIPSI